jgi:hypothetical protein
MSDHFTPSEEFLLEYMAPVGWRYSMAMLFWEADGNFLGQLSAIRREEQGDFTDAEMTTWRVLHPHVNAAVRRLFAMEKASAARTSLEDSVQSLPMPMTIVGWDLSVDFSIGVHARPSASGGTEAIGRGL